MSHFEAGPRSQAIFARDQEHMAPGLQSIALFSRIAMDHGRGALLVDADGKTYVDFVAGVAVGSLGAAHPHWVARMKAQAEKLVYGSFATESRARFLELLASTTPDGLKQIQLYSGGAEAVEAAFRMAKSVTKGYEFVGFYGGFHGKTGGVMGLLGSDTRKELGPYLPGQYLAPYAYCYRCPLGLKYPSCGIACAEGLRDVLRYQTEGKVAAIVIEPMQGTAGNVIPPKGFLSAVQEIAREFGALLIADEMITGFGRTGKMWGVQHEGIVPDAMTIGKGIGAGFPMSALVTREDLAAAKPFGAPSGSSSSYGGNPFAATAGLAVVEVILEEGLVERSRVLGERMLERLRGMQERFPFIGDVRGQGLMIGVELVKDRDTKEPLSKALCRTLFERALARGLLSMSYGPCIRINPPLVITDEQADTGLSILEEVFAEIEREGTWREA